jgi:hypothetical protein
MVCVISVVSVVSVAEYVVISVDLRPSWFRGV